MVEFALLAPIFFFVLLATVDGGLLLYSKGSIDHSADIGFTSLAALGNCVNVPNCANSDADQVTLQRMRNAGLGSPALTKINSITFTLMVQHSDGSIAQAASSDSVYTNECTGSPCANKYTLNGTATMSNWTIANRSVTNGSADFVKLDIQYDYQYFAVSQPTLTITVTKVFRLEPQT